MTKAEQKRLQEEKDNELVANSDYVIDAYTHDWNAIYEKKTGRFVTGYKRRSSAVRKIKQLVEDELRRETERIERLKSADLLWLCRQLKYKIPPMREISGIMREKHDENDGETLFNTLKYLNGDLNLIKTRLETIETLIIRLTNPEHGMIKNDGVTDA